MSPLDRAIAGLALELHPNRLRAVAAAVENSGKGPLFQAVENSLGANSVSAALAALRTALAGEPGCTGVEMALRLRTAAAVADMVAGLSSTELVWTGPATGLVPIRHTEQVLTELIDGARDRLFLVSFVAYNVPGVTGALARAVRRGVNTRILLERSQADGGSVAVDSLSLLRERIPGASFFTWKRDPDENPAVVHAKCAVADGAAAFITSANLTGAAMERNMELGVLVRGGDVPLQLARHLTALITTRTIVPA